MNTIDDNCGGRIILTSLISVKPDCIEAFIALAANIVAASRRESGCLEYRFLQEPGAAGTFFFFEKYESTEALQYHSAQEYLSEFRRLRQPMLSEQPCLSVYRITSADC